MDIIFNQNNTFTKILSNRMVRHVVYWVFIVLAFGLFWGSDKGAYKILIISELVLLPGKMLAVYTNIYYLMPRFLFRKEYTKFILYSLVLGISIGVVQRIIAYYVLVPINYVYDPTIELFNIYEIAKLTFDINTVMIIPFGVKILRIWYKEQLQAKELEKQKIENELKFLKNQVQPHFLFNTLNNLYGLILKKSDKAGDIVLKLSDLMRYLLYDTREDKVLLEKEINYIRNYLELEKLRYGSKVDISFQTYGNIKGKYIAPIIILPFLENSFKHGVSKSMEKAWITIEISIDKNKYIIKIENSKPQKLNRQDTIESGIGLSNLRRRLDLLYSDNYTIRIEDNEDSFRAYLEILQTEENHIDYE
jgi:two-component system LytT family sensor kinase